LAAAYWARFDFSSKGFVILFALSAGNKFDLFQIYAIKENNFLQ
jgi:hypothetical protein